jgi:hypothetical protein
MSARPIDATPLQGPDPEATAENGVAFSDLRGGREIVSKEGLCARLTALMRACEGCENVTVTEVWQYDRPDRKDGCNWELAVALDPAGVAPEVYGLAYASILRTARSRWNLEEQETKVAVLDFDLG